MSGPQHVVSPLTYLLVFGALLGLTVVTVLVNQAPLGWLHAPAALGIAVIKATLVILFFMHAMYSSRLVWVVILGSLLMLGVLLVQTLMDYWSRGWLQV